SDDDDRDDDADQKSGAGRRRFGLDARDPRVGASAEFVGRHSLVVRHDESPVGIVALPSAGQAGPYGADAWAMPRSSGRQLENVGGKEKFPRRDKRRNSPRRRCVSPMQHPPAQTEERLPWEFSRKTSRRWTISSS